MMSSTTTFLPLHVVAGQTLLLELSATSETLDLGNGAVRLFMVDEAGNPIVTGSAYLESLDGKKAYEVAIEKEGEKKGAGFIDDVIPGTYTITLEEPEVIKNPPPKKEQLKPIVYFTHNSDKRTKEGNEVVNIINSDVIEQVAKQLAESETENLDKLFCIGFANQLGSSVYNVDLSIRRAKAVSKILIPKLKEHLPDRVIEVKLDGYGGIKGKEKKALRENRRVEFWLHEKPDRSEYDLVA